MKNYDKSDKKSLGKAQNFKKMGKDNEIMTNMLERDSVTK